MHYPLGALLFVLGLPIGCSAHIANQHWHPWQRSALYSSGSCGALNQTWPWIPAPRNIGQGYGQHYNAVGGMGSPTALHGKATNGQPLPQPKGGGHRPRSLILSIPDGFGPASETFAREYSQWLNPELGWNHLLPADSIQIGTVRTRSSDSFVTDSAAAATAYACAIKSYNRAIGVDENGNPCGTVMEAAKAAGYHTGLVVTSRVTHATPAAFYTHIFDRDAEDVIALQVAGNTPLRRAVDVVLGGGLGWFLPNTTQGSLRADTMNVVEIANANGYTVITDRAGFDALGNGTSPTAANPYLGMFALSHMSYEVDRLPGTQPSLLEMVKTAVKSLERMSHGKKKGFFIMIEASLIDRAGHGNDLVAHLHDILMWQEVVAWIKHYVDRHPDTTFVGCADHETGGLSLGGIATDNEEYMWNPAPLQAGKHSAGYLAAAWHAAAHADEDTAKSIFAEYGIVDANSTEIEDSISLKDDLQNMEVHIGQSLTRRGLVKWSTLGHSGVDVNLYGYGLNVDRLRGNHDNTEIGQFIADQLGLDLPAVTRQLNDPANEAYLVEQVGRDKVQRGVISVPLPKSLGRRSTCGHHD